MEDKKYWGMRIKAVLEEIHKLKLYNIGLLSDTPRGREVLEIVQSEMKLKLEELKNLRILAGKEAEDDLHVSS